MNKKNLLFFVISIICLLFLYFYSFENAKYYWGVDDGSGNIYSPFEYLADNPEKFKGKNIYYGGYVELKDGKIFIPYLSIFPTNEKIKAEIVNPEKFQLENRKYYGFNARIIDVKTEDNVKVVEIYATEKFQRLFDIPFVIFEILFNVSALLIILYLLLKLKINFRKILIEAKP